MLYDLAIIGAGINGAGIARDAAGRGLKVLLCDKGDIGGATSSASTKLIHGGLRYLEHYAFGLVRKALREREILWSIAPHIIRPMRFVLPHHPGLRPAWMIQAGLFLYDHLAPRAHLPKSRRVGLRRTKSGTPLQDHFKTGFCYSDCWVEDNRLVVLNAMDAREHGADIRPYCACTKARRHGEHWQITLTDQATGDRSTLQAKAVINAAGPWVNDVFAGALETPPPLPIRMVKGSHIIVPKLFDHPYSYLFQNTDGRIVFAIPFEDDFTLIGTTDEDFQGDPMEAKASVDETVYLCNAVGDYLKVAPRPEDVIWSYAGVRPLIQADGDASSASRDYRFHLDHAPGQAPLLSIYGGKITTYRTLAEAALAKLNEVLPLDPLHKQSWTGLHPLPGGDIAAGQMDEWVISCQGRWPWLDHKTLHRLTHTYGTRIERLLGDARRPGHLGQDFGGGVSEAELTYLQEQEWTHSANAALWKRTKLGLHLDQAQREAIQVWFGS